ncbi:MAG: sulfur carrier protein ThiS [Acetobacteraceae bacterium]
MHEALPITVNGESERLAEPTTVAELLARFGIDRRKVAVERNLEIVPHSLYGETWLAAGDQLEIVHFIGGG